MKLFKIVLAATITATGLGVSTTAPVQAQDYLGTVKYLGFNFCPQDTLSANGALLSIAQNQALFSLLGTYYGGDGRTSFALPDLRGRVSVGAGRGPGLSDYRMGQKSGREDIILTPNNLPAHTHAAILRAADRTPTSDNPSGRILGDFEAGRMIYADPPANVSMASDAIQVGTTGGSQPVNNMQPYTVVNACIVSQGLYPPRS